MVDLFEMGERIRIERKRQLLTIEQLAEKAAISENYLGKIERGAGTASLQTINNISLALNISIDYLLGRTESNTEYRFISSLIDINNLNDESKEKFIDFVSNNIKYFK